MMSDLFIPHGHCYLWNTQLVGLHLLSDLTIAIAYFSIPLTLFYFVEQREDLPFNWIFTLFGAFIILYHPLTRSVDAVASSVLALRLG